MVVGHNNISVQVKGYGNLGSVNIMTETWYAFTSPFENKIG